MIKQPAGERTDRVESQNDKTTRDDDVINTRLNWVLNANDVRIDE